MIPLWKQIFRQNFTKLEDLAQFLEWDHAQKNQFLPNSRFALNIPLRLAKKIQKQTLEDPLLKQFLPSKKESILTPGFMPDPVMDASFRQGQKLLHKYNGRALLVCTSACAMHCRYCFRQNFSYQQQDKTFEEELKWIERDPSIHEIILSGGDPLSLSNEVLASLFLRLDAIAHITRIRIHTRFPIGIPERVDEEFLKIIRQTRAQIWFVIHVNHVREIDEEILLKMKALQQIGCVILNQSVLLKGVNDEVGVLKELCETLVNHGILPYYLHQLDRVEGSAHFEVEEEKGRGLIQELSKHLPGYAIPKYVKEMAGEPHKTVIRI